MSNGFDGLTVLYAVAAFAAIRCWYREQVRHGKRGAE